MGSMLSDGEAALHITTIDRDLGIIEARVEGLCTLEEFQAFVGELRSAIMSFGIQGRSTATLYDFTKAAIQTQDVVAAMKALAEHPAMSHRRVAMYTEGVLARRQAQLVSQNRTNMRVFSTRRDALEWLASPRDKQPASAA